MRFFTKKGTALAGPLRSRIIEEAISFQTPIDEIAAERAPFFLRGTSYVIMGLFLAMLAIAAWVKVDIVIVGSGRLSTDIPPIVLQPIERSIIREFKVKVGDKVTKGQVLATLDPTFTQADVASLEVQRRALQAQIHRLESELSGIPYQPGDAGNADDLLQKSLYFQRQAQFKSRIDTFDQDIERLESNVTSVKNTKKSLATQLEINKEVETMRLSLLKSEYGSRLNYLAARADRTRAERELEEADNRLPELFHTLESKRAEKETFLSEWRRQLLENLVSVRTEMAKLGEGLSKAARMNELVVLKSPEDGVVLDVAKRSVGSVMREAEPLITIVPSNATLIAEISITSSDVGYTKTGDDAVIKVDAFPYQRHGMLRGRLLSVSEDSFAPGGGGGGEMGGNPLASKTGAAVHRGRVSLDSLELKDMNKGSGLIPGMTLSADIKIGSRSVLGYFLNPITRTFQESIREP